MKLTISEERLRIKRFLVLILAPLVLSVILLLGSSMLRVPALAQTTADPFYDDSNDDTYYWYDPPPGFSGDIFNSSAAPHYQGVGVIIPEDYSLLGRTVGVINQPGDVVLGIVPLEESWRRNAETGDDFSPSPGAQDFDLDNCKNEGSDAFAGSGKGIPWHHFPLRVYFASNLAYSGREHQIQLMLKRCLDKWTKACWFVSYLVTDDYRCADLVFSCELTADHEWTECCRQFCSGTVSQVKVKILDSSFFKLSDQQLESACTHTIGHALGVVSHSNGTDVMAPDCNEQTPPVVTVSAYDGALLKQVYGKMHWTTWLKPSSHAVPHGDIQSYPAFN